MLPVGMEPPRLPGLWVVPTLSLCQQPDLKHSCTIWLLQQWILGPADALLLWCADELTSACVWLCSHAQGCDSQVLWWRHQPEKEAAQEAGCRQEAYEGELTPVSHAVAC